jgi:DNA polymerase-1
MIAAINGGLDPHTYVAELLGISRKFAKTLNFGLLYGMGPTKLAEALGCSYQEAVNFINLYFSKLPRVKVLFDKVKRTFLQRGYIFNKYGRRYYLDDAKFAYKLVNYLIQGTGADTVRMAMPKIADVLRRTKSAMLLQVHDELVFEFDVDDLHLIPKIKEIMETTYTPFNGMKLTVGCEWSKISWA